MIATILAVQPHDRGWAGVSVWRIRISGRPVAGASAGLDHVEVADRELVVGPLLVEDDLQALLDRPGPRRRRDERGVGRPYLVKLLVGEGVQIGPQCGPPF